ncbi:MAG: molybdate ABC transporter permease subunit [Thermoflexales bacterium]|nr:molybdate ABC transporter permease subunit [Thermoflexales bacterium]
MSYHTHIHHQRPLWTFLAASGLATALLALPLMVVAWRGLSVGFAYYLTNPTVIAAITLSLSTSLTSVIVTLLLGTPLAYTLARWRFRYKAAIELVVDLPIVLPPLVAGIGLLLTFGRNGTLGPVLDALGIRLPFTTAAVIVAMTFVSAPLFIRATRLGFAAIQPEIMEAAYVDGATERQLFWHIMLPLASRAMLNGLILAWARAFGEFGATIVFAGNLEGSTQTMPLAIFIGFETDLGIALGLALVLMLLSAVVLLILRRLESHPDLTV